jgi:putative ABC transport system permease protein
LFRTGLGIILISSILLNGLVPAITLNAKKGIDLLKLRHKSAQGKISLRQVLVVAQFSIVIGIIVSILSIDKQVDFLVNKEKGLSVNNKLVITTPKYMGRASNRFNNLNAFEQELVRHPNIEGVSMGSAVPGSSAAHNFTFSEEGSDASGKAALIITDRNFIENYNIQLIEGENFSSGLKGCIINKTCLSQLGYKSGEEALGKNLKMTDDSQMQKLSYKIIGVTEDYNFQSAKKHPEAMILIDLTEKMVWGNYTVALNSANYSSVIPFVKKHFETTFPNYPFEYFVPEDLYKTEMKSEAQLLSMLKIFVLIALAISIINLFSMALHNASARVKEIGIRKVNGAKISEVMTLLNKDFLKWVVIASVIACPVTYYAMNKWLENFAYRTTLSWWLFVLAGVLALGIAILTVSWQSWKAATRNPIEALRYE